MKRHSAAAGVAVAAALGAAFFAGCAAVCFVRAQNTCECGIRDRSSVPYRSRKHTVSDKLRGAAQAALGAASHILYFLDRVTCAEK